MSKETFERLFGAGWRKHLEEVRWQAQHSVHERAKRTNTKPSKKLKK